MVNNKLIAIDEETRKELETYKIHPREPVGDVVRKILNEYKELKAKEKEPQPIDLKTIQEAPKLVKKNSPKALEVTNINPKSDTIATTDVTPAQVGTEVNTTEV